MACRLFSSFVYCDFPNIIQVEAKFVAFIPTRMQLLKVFRRPSALNSQLSKKTHSKWYIPSEAV